MKVRFSCLSLCLLIILSACGPKAPTWQEQYDLGVRYLEEGNYEEAIIAFTAAIEIDPRAESYLGRGQAYMLSGGTEETVVNWKGKGQKQWNKRKQRRAHHRHGTMRRSKPGQCV